jgi:hypothetical protein
MTDPDWKAELRRELDTAGEGQVRDSLAKFGIRTFQIVSSFTPMPRGCRIEFGELNFAFQHLIKPHMDQQLAKAVLQDGWLPDVLAEPGAPPEPS